jgi:hypothetical protein
MRNREVTFADSARFVLKIMRRSLTFAIFGTPVIALWGSLNGLWMGAFASFYGAIPGDLREGYQVGIAWNGGASFVAGVLAMTTAAILSYAIHHPQYVLLSAIKGAIVWSFAGLWVSGAAGGSTNLLYSILTRDDYSIRGSAWGFVFSVWVGFIIGILYGAPKAALVEIRRRGELI